MTIKNQPDSLSSLHEAIDVEAVVALTKALVDIPSANPPGDESAVADYLLGVLADLGLHTEVVEPVPGRVSVLAQTGDGRQTGKPILLINGHIDTVPANPSSWTHDPFTADVRHGRIYGRGTTDMKGGVAAAISAYSVCRQLGIDLPCELVFHLVADEELGGTHGTGHLLEAGRIVADAAIIPEPTSLQLCLAERGLMFARITTSGIPAHGSDPDRGRSAIMSAAAIAETLHGSRFSSDSHPLLGETTCNVGMIKGGSGPNVVPEFCELLIDRRAIPGDTMDSLVQGIEHRIATVGLEPGSYELEVQTYCEPSEISADDPFVAHLSEAFRDMTGREPAFTGLPFTTDARFIRNQLGLPAVVFGPGDLSLAHTIDEYVEIDDLVTAVGVYARIFSNFTGVKQNQTR